MTINLITLFPELIKNFLEKGVVGQAVRSGLVKINYVQPRDFTSDEHHSVDDRPFGGGDGMVMMIDPLLLAIESLADQRGLVVGLSPQGEVWNDNLARQWAKDQKNITLICGRYAGIDERVRTHLVDREISLGDFVLSGGEVAALALIDSMARFLPGVLGNPDSPQEESFANGLLECPQFTRPQQHAVGGVPQTLLSGHHDNISQFRLAVSLVRTRKLRPDLLAKSHLKDRLAWAKKWLEKIDDTELRAVGLERADIDPSGGVL